MAVVPALATTGSVERLPLAGLDARAGEARSSSSHPSARKPEAVPKAPAPRELHSTGKLAPVPPEAETSADSRGLGFAVEVERGVPVEPSGFGREVERTLLDERGWTAAGTHYIARTARCVLPGHVGEPRNHRRALLSARDGGDLVLLSKTAVSSSTRPDGSVGRQSTAASSEATASTW